jgi:hypothetical protein
VGALANPPGLVMVRCINDGALAVLHNTTTPVLFAGEEYKSEAGLHSTSSNTSRIVATRAGKWRCSWQLSFAANATGLRLALLTKNGVTVNGSGAIGPGNSVFETALQGTTTIALAVGDYVELSAYQNSTVTLNVGNTIAVAAQRVSALEAQWLGA